MYMNPRVTTVASHNPVRPAMTLETLANYLLPVSTVYLALPHLIFYVGWLQWHWALFATGLLCVALAMMTWVATQVVTEEVQEPEPVQGSTSSRATGEGKQTFAFTRQHALMVGAVCLIWLAISGVGGFVRQDYDWEKHNVIFNSLILKPWPTLYQIYG